MAIPFIYKSLNQSYRKSQGIWTLKCLPVFNDKVSSSIETMINAMTRSCDRNDPKGMFILFLSIISIYSKKKQSALKINRKKGDKLFNVYTPQKWHEYLFDWLGILVPLSIFHAYRDGFLFISIRRWDKSVLGGKGLIVVHVLPVNVINSPER